MPGPSVLQTKSFEGEAASVVIAPDVAVSEGSLGVIAIQHSKDLGGTSPATPAGWTLATSRVHATSGRVRLFIFYKLNMTAGETLPTITWTGDQVYVALFDEYDGDSETAGVALLTELDKTATAEGNASPASSGTTAALAQNTEFGIAYFATTGLNSTSAGTNSYTKTHEEVGPPSLAKWTKFITSGGTTGTAVTLTNVLLWIGAVITFKATVVPHAAEADLQAASTLEAEATLDPRPQSDMQAAARFIIGSPIVSNNPEVDFTKYDAYVNMQGFVYFEGAQAVTETQELRPTRQDVGNNPDEIRPESGDIFGMSDFSGGGNQEFYHKPNSSNTAFFSSEGYDISRPGQLTHLREVSEAHNSADIGATAQVQDLPFVVDGTNVRRGDGAFPGTWTAEDPHVAEGAVDVLDLAASGDELYAALGVNGVHVRNAAGVWSHYQPDVSTDLDIGTATLVAWAKDRLIAVGGAGVSIYEIVADSTPTAIKTLPAGWVFTDIFETGEFIYAPAVNTNSGQSRIHILGLAAAGTTIEDKGSTQMPHGQLCYSGTGYLNAVFLGCGKRNSSGGYDPLIYQAIPAESGHLSLQKLAEEEGAGATNLSVGAVAPLGESVLFGWSQTSASSGDAREGLAIFHLGRAAFTNHIRKQAPAGTPARITSILVYQGRVLFSVDGDGLYYEDLTNYVDEANLVSSIADYFNAGSKAWSYLEQTYKPLPATSSVTLEYTTLHPEDDTWAEGLTDNTTSSTSSEGALSRTEARRFAVRLNSTSTTDQSDAPTLLAFAVRSDALPSATEYNLVRYLRIFPEDNKRKGEPFTQDPKEIRRDIQALAWHHVKFFEADATWDARIISVADYEPAQAQHETTSGDNPKEGYILRLTLRGTRDN